jgi:hypothetical protein
MPRLRTVKLHNEIYEKLMDIPNAEDINDAIRKLFYTLQNEAERQGAAEFIEHNKEIIKENEERIKNLPSEKAQFVKDYNEKYEHQAEAIAIKKRICELQLANLSIPHPRFGWESDPEWLQTIRTDIESSIKTADYELEQLERKRKQILEEERQAENYDIVKVRLEQQNNRAKQEIERMEKIIELCKKLEIDIPVNG